MVGILLPVSNFVLASWYTEIKIDWPCQFWSKVIRNPEELSFDVISIIEGMRLVLQAGRTQEVRGFLLCEGRLRPLV